MQIYKVGGAVRDTILGITPKDVDYVVIGATPAEMRSLGFSQVGADFPVFLHPDTKEEYALGRPDRAATASGADDPSTVTLEEDLMRRDLTINAIAMTQDGGIVDPWGGVDDLRRRILRHVSDSFAEDPLRVLRVARFRARYGGEWSVAGETRTLMRELVSAGAIDGIAGERIWREMEKGLNEQYPELMLKELGSLGLFERGAFAMYGGATNQHLEVLREAVACNAPVAVRAAFAFPMLGAGRNKNGAVPGEVAGVSMAVNWLLDNGVLDYDSMTSSARLRSLEMSGGFRVGSRYDLVLMALACHRRDLPATMEHDLAAAKSVDIRAVTEGVTTPADIPETVRRARSNAIDQQRSSHAQSFEGVPASKCPRP